MKQTRQSTTLVSHNVTIDGRRTSIRLEPDMWSALKEICVAEDLTVHEFCSRVDSHREQSALTAAIRVAIMAYYRDKMRELAGYLEQGGFHLESQGHGTDGNGNPSPEPNRNGAPMRAAAKPIP